MLSLAWSFPTNHQDDYIIHHPRRWHVFDYIYSSIKLPHPALSEMPLDTYKIDKVS
jgi:hypothetical protein